MWLCSAGATFVIGHAMIIEAARRSSDGRRGELAGKALKPIRDRLAIATKFGFGLERPRADDPFGLRMDEAIMEIVEE